MGIVTDAVKKAHVDKATHYRWLENDTAYKKAVDEINESVLDMAESSLFKQVKKANTVATIFLLKTKGKKRGYIEKQEFGYTDSEGRDVPIIFKPSNDEPLK